MKYNSRRKKVASPMSLSRAKLLTQARKGRLCPNTHMREYAYGLASYQEFGLTAEIIRSTVRRAL
jgi:hypothetical protein